MLSRLARILAFSSTETEKVACLVGKLPQSRARDPCCAVTAVRSKGATAWALSSSLLKASSRNINWTTSSNMVIQSICIGICCFQMRDTGLSGRGELGGDLESNAHFCGIGTTGLSSRKNAPIRSALWTELAMYHYLSTPHSLVAQ
jgi:hypothetical protein